MLLVPPFKKMKHIVLANEKDNIIRLFVFAIDVGCHNGG
jgi:hypothetical protein